MFEFLRTMWIMRRIDEIYLTKMVTKKRITEEEKQTILTVKQMAE